MQAPRVNASMLQQHVGKLVTLVGEVSEVSPSGQELKILASDRKVVRAALMEPLAEEPRGVVEVIAKVERDGSLVAQRLISYMGNTEFDLGLYNEAVKLATKFPEYFGCSPHVNGY